MSKPPSTASRLRRLAVAVATLLAPVDAERWASMAEAAADPTTSWRRAVLRDVGAFVGTDRLSFLLPGTSRLVVYSDAVAPSAQRYADEHFATDPGPMARAARGLALSSTSMLYDRAALRRSALYREVLVPARATEGVWLAAGFHDAAGRPTPLHPALGVHWAHGEGHARATMLELLGMLRPAFEAGVRAVTQRPAVADAPSAVAAVLDQLDVAALCCDADGGVLHTSRACEELLWSEPERAHVLRVVQERARALATGAPGAGEPRRLQTHAGTYLVTTSMLDGADGGAARVVARLSPVVERTPARDHRPLRARVRDRWELTTREADVALLIAQRLRDREIAERLGISPHTTRRHTERVLAKLGVHSRRDVVHRVAACGDPTARITPGRTA